MIGNSIPTAGEVNKIDDPQVMGQLIRRSDLPRHRSWWATVISVCNSSMIGAESGEIDAEVWASLLVESLDTAFHLGAFAVEDAVHRKITASLLQFIITVSEAEILRVIRSVPSSA